MASNWADTVFNRLNHASLTALVSDRIFPSKPASEPTGNYLCFWREGGDFGLNLDASHSSQVVTLRCEATAANQAQAEAIVKATRDRLHGWKDLTVGVLVCAAQGDCDEQTLEDGRQVSGQGFSLRWRPV